MGEAAKPMRGDQPSLVGDSEGCSGKGLLFDSVTQNRKGTRKALLLIVIRWDEREWEVRAVLQGSHWIAITAG